MNYLSFMDNLGLPTFKEKQMFNFAKKIYKIAKTFSWSQISFNKN